MAIREGGSTSPSPGPRTTSRLLDAAQRPVQFPATASYIVDNKLTGTPAGPFGEVQTITVDDAGKIYVTDAGEKVIDVFNSTGEFDFSIPAPRSNGWNPTLGGVGVDPTDGSILITEGGYDVESDTGGIAEYDSSGNLLGRIKSDGTLGGFGAEGTPSVDSAGRLYVPVGNERVDIFGPAPRVPTVTYKPVASPTTTGGTLGATIDPTGAGSVTACHFEYGTSRATAWGPCPAPRIRQRAHPVAILRFRPTSPPNCRG